VIAFDCWAVSLYSCVSSPTLTAKIKPMKTRLALACVALCLLSACGIKGPLETAPPMWGPDRAAYEAEQAKKAEEAKAKKAAEDAEKAGNSAPSTAPQ
jgi:predicted small lipoprotein YifL